MTDKAITEHQLAVAREELDDANERIAELETQLANFEGRLGVDKKPSEDQFVEIYCQTKCSSMRTWDWTGWPPHKVQDWHLWRPIFVPDETVLARSKEIRQQLGVVELESNGFYRLPEKDDES